MDMLPPYQPQNVIPNPSAQGYFPQSFNSLHVAPLSFTDTTPIVQKMLSIQFPGLPKLDLPSSLPDPNSPLGRYNADALTAARLQPTQVEASLPQIGAQGAGANAAMDAYRQAGFGAPDANAYQWSPVSGGVYPDRVQPDIPVRPALHVSPIASALGALGGIFDPRSAGMYSAAPIQAAQALQQQNYGDRQLAFQQATAQSANAYEDALRQRAEQLQLTTMNQQQQFAHDQALRAAQMQAGGVMAPYAGTAAQSDYLAGALPGLSDAQRAANVAQAQVGADTQGIHIPMEMAQLGNQLAGTELQRYGQVENAITNNDYRKNNVETNRLYRQGQIDNDIERLRQQQERTQLTHDIAQVKIDSMGNMTQNGRPMTEGQRLGLQLRAASMGITLPPEMIGGQQYAIPGISDLASRNAQIALTREQLRNPIISSAQRDYDMAVENRNSMFRVYQAAVGGGRITDPGQLASWKSALDRADAELTQKAAARDAAIKSVSVLTPGTPGAGSNSNPNQTGPGAAPAPASRYKPVAPPPGAPVYNLGGGR